MNFFDKVLSNPSFDISHRILETKVGQVELFYLTSLSKDEMISEIIKGIMFKERGDLKSYLLVGDVKDAKTQKDLEAALLSGNLVVVEENKAYTMDTRFYPTRSVEEPETEKSVRGSKDGFTENIKTNVGLVRRRIRQLDLTFEKISVGNQNPMDIALSYLKDSVDPKILSQVQERLTSLSIKDLVMSDRALEECLLNQGYNPFPLVRYSERPDIVASHIMNGHIAIICDTSSSVMLLPTTIFEILEHVEEHRQTPLIGTMIRLIRLAAVFISVYLVPFWLIAYRYPAFSHFFVYDYQTPFNTLVMQVLVVEFSIELLRIATVHTPSALSNAMGIVAAILLGDLAIELGFFTPEILLYCSIGNVGGFATPNYELSLTNKYIKIAMIIFIGLFKEIGFIVFNLFLFLYLMHLRPFGIPYLYPLIPFNGKALLKFLIRKPRSKDLKKS